MGDLLRDFKLVGAFGYLIILAAIGLLATSIANDGGPIPFDPNASSGNVEIYSPPGTIEQEGTTELVHYFGTDQIGRDVASRLIHGIPIAFKVGIWSSLISLIIALILGGVAGYFGNRTHRFNMVQLLFLISGLVLSHFYIQEYSFRINEDGEFGKSISFYFTGMVLTTGVIIWIILYLGKLRITKYWLPWDTIIVKLMEVFKSIPKLFLLLAVFAMITTPSILWVILIIGFIRWPNLARIVRAEIIAIKQESFVQNSRILGLPDWRIFVFHVLPNIYKSIVVLTAFNMGSAILIESSLSFLQIGLPSDAVSWGRMLGDARSYMPAWWMAIGPGFLIFTMILAFNILGDRLSWHFDALSSKPSIKI